MTDPCAAFEPLHSAWLDGQLDGYQRRRLEAHLDTCEACRRDLDGLARTRALLRSQPVRQVPSGLFPAPEAVAELEPVWEARDRRPARRAGRAAAAVAVLVGLVGGAAFGLGGQPEPAAQLVRVPVDKFTADHLVRTVGLP